LELSRAMSALCQKRTSCTLAKITLLDHLVSGDEQSLRHRDAERLGRFEVDEQFDFRELLDWQVCRPLSFQNATSVDTGQAIGFFDVTSVAG
jgi:hypothetical protein